MTKNRTRIDHTGHDHDSTPGARAYCRNIMFDVSGHLRDCVQRAADAAYNNRMVDDPQGDLALAAGRNLLHAELIDCTCGE